jgi:hypothetical protein
MNISRFYFLMFLLFAYVGLLIGIAFDEIDEDLLLPSLVFGFPLAGISIIYLFRNPPPKRK